MIIFLHMNLSYQLIKHVTVKEMAVSAISTAEDVNDTISLRGRRTKGRGGEVECERETRREREARSLGARRERPP